MRHAVRYQAQRGWTSCGRSGRNATDLDGREDWHCAVTPRHRKAVEIQALWYNALRVMEDLSQRLSRGAPARFRDLADQTAASFEELFWNPEIVPTTSSTATFGTPLYVPIRFSRSAYFTKWYLRSAHYGSSRLSSVTCSLHSVCEACRHSIQNTAGGTKVIPQLVTALTTKAQPGLGSCGRS